ncbi:superoxide dismutase [Mn], mitochondrial-like [Quercus lobata]|uniref:superoxide dismutase [Mn], mitochondrial-like n=1 Tax=Quercus lobata TaxID=97700 RepID=UPI00124878C4|nr:superoxide dismutase [Mn], mitochondrial-like [Quercus lobata]
MEAIAATRALEFAREIGITDAILEGDSCLVHHALTRGLAVGHVRGLQSFSLPELPCDYGALEPVISGEIMQLHHQKHHQTYITNYNKALEQLDQALAKADSSSIVQLQSAIKFNGGEQTKRAGVKREFGILHLRIELREEGKD